MNGFSHDGLAGSCQCASVRYVVTAQPFVSYTCHCRECQKLTSSAFTTCIQVPAEAVRITHGKAGHRVRSTDSGNPLTSWFCTECGSALFAQSSARPRLRTIFVGTLEHPELVEVNAHIWVKRKLPWVNLPANHRVFEGPGDWSEDYASDMSRYKP